MSFVRRLRFRSGALKACRLICDKGVIGDGELQHLLNFSLETYYRVEKAPAAPRVMVLFCFRVEFWRDLGGIVIAVAHARFCRILSA